MNTRKTAPSPSAAGFAPRSAQEIGPEGVTMLDAHLTRRSFISLAAAATVAGVVAEPSWAGVTASSEEAIEAWINRHAVPLPRTDAGGSIDDLDPLRCLVADAHVVGLGESAHGTHEQFTLKHRAARFLTERVGFRTLAWEENWGSGVAIDRYVVGGGGDPRSLVAAMSSIWRSEEMLELVRWMHAYNLAHDDKVRFLGTDLTQLRQLLFDEIVQYVSDVAPERLEELVSHLDPLRLRGTPRSTSGGTCSGRTSSCTSITPVRCTRWCWALRPGRRRSTASTPCSTPALLRSP
jgi:Erythromycin esterase